MDLSEITKKLGLSQPKHLIPKAAELRRLADVQFDSSVIGVGEICKAIICLEIATARMDVIFDRQAAVKLSGMSERAYIRCFNSMQNGIGVKNKVDVRELAIQFGCVRLIPFVHKGLSLYKDRFLSSLPPSRRETADFTRPVFTAVAFYLCSKRHKLKVDKIKLIEICGTLESEFTCICWMHYLKRGLLRTVVIHLMMERSLLPTKSAGERKNMIMKGGNLQFWLPTITPRQKPLLREPAKLNFFKKTLES